MLPWGDFTHRLFAYLNTYAHDFRDYALLLLGGVALGMAIEWSRPLEKSQPKAGTRFNVMYALLAGGCLLLLRPLIYSGSLWTVQYFGGGLIRFAPTGLGFAAAVLTLWLVTDLFEYLFHRVQHAVPWMWAMHELHHSEETYNVTLTYRHYWFEFVLKGLFVYPLVGILLKAPPAAAGVVALVFLVNHVVAHMNVGLSLGPCWAWISTPQFHRLHHSRDPRHYDKNFCDMLPLWDLLFGTASKPEPGEFCEIGLMPSHKPATLWQALVWPFARRRFAIDHGYQVLRKPRSNDQGCS